MEKWKGGGQAFGYSYDKGTSTLIIDRKEIDVLKRIFELALENTGVTNIADELNKIGFLPRRGKKWSATTVSYILSPTHLKFYRGLNKDDKPGDWKPLLSEFEYSRLVKIREVSKSKFVAPKRKEKTRYLLSAIGIFKCGYCNGPVKSSVTIKNNKKTLYYCCTSKQSSGSNSCLNSRLHKQEVINNLVLNDVQERISHGSRIEDYIQLFQDNLLKEARLTYKSIGIYFAKYEDLEIEQAQKYLRAQLRFLDELNERKSKIVSPALGREASSQSTILQNVESINLFNDYLEVQYKFPIRQPLEFIQTIKFEI